MKKRIAIIYVGKKQTSHDNVARSGKIWNGPGDIQEVTEDQAQILLRYPDQWALAPAKENESNPDGGNDPDADNPDADNPDDGEEDEEIGQDANQTNTAKIPFEKMNKSELIDFAQKRWGKEFQADLTKKQMIDEIEAWLIELG